MKKSMLVVLVVLAVLGVNAMATVIPLVNGDFETGTGAWTTAPIGWTNWTRTGAPFVISLPDFAPCPDGGANALLYSGQASGTQILTFAQLTDTAIVSGQTYTLATNVGSAGYYTLYTTPLASVTAVIYAVNPVNLASANLAVISATDADFTGNNQWKAYSASYVADSQYEGWDIGVYLTFAGNNYGPVVDSVVLSVVPEPATVAMLLTGMVGLLLKKRRAQSLVSIKRVVDNFYHPFFWKSRYNRILAVIYKRK